MKILGSFFVPSFILFSCICILCNHSQSQWLSQERMLMLLHGAVGSVACVHLLTEEQGSMMPNGLVLNSTALGSISHWTMFVGLFKLIISFFHRPFTNTFTNHRTSHMIFSECSSYGMTLPEQVCFCGLQILCSGCPFPVSSPCDINN